MLHESRGDDIDRTPFLGGWCLFVWKGNFLNKCKLLSLVYPQGILKLLKGKKFGSQKIWKKPEVETVFWTLGAVLRFVNALVRVLSKSDLRTMQHFVLSTEHAWPQANLLKSYYDSKAFLKYSSKLWIGEDDFFLFAPRAVRTLVLMFAKSEFELVFPRFTQWLVDQRRRLASSSWDIAISPSTVGTF